MIIGHDLMVQLGMISTIKHNVLGKDDSVVPQKI